MAQFPAPVADYLRALAIDHRAPAYLLSARDGRLAACGGELARYALAGLVVGERLDDQVVYLMGLLPLEAGERQLIECLQIDGCPPTDAWTNNFQRFVTLIGPPAGTLAGWWDAGRSAAARAVPY